MDEDETIGELIDLVEHHGGSAMVEIGGKWYAITIYGSYQREESP